MSAEIRHCLNPACGKRIPLPKGYANWPEGKGKYCSRSCNGKARGEAMKQRMLDWQSERLNYVIEEVDFLIGTDCSEHLARRLGYKLEGLIGAMRSRGREDLADKLIQFQYTPVKEARFDPYGTD